MELECVYPKDPSEASPYETRRSLRHVIFTAETHNFPTGQDAQNVAFTCDFSVPFVPPPCAVFPNNHSQSRLSSSGVAPFSGATTGTGGRIRDVQSAGQGGHVIAGTAGYCFGNLHIPGVPERYASLSSPEMRNSFFGQQCVLSHRPPLQVTLSPGSLKETAGSIRPASPPRCRWQSRPATEPRTTATSLENLFCQVGTPLMHAWIYFNG